MATYIKGVTDVIPGSIEMAPDYKMMVYALSTLQNKYDKGFNQVKSVYNSMINSALSVPGNEEFKTNFLKKADAELARLSSVDLGNANNVYQATRIFDPLLNDKEFMYDLTWTKNQANQMAKLEQVKNSTDEKVYSRYSPIMERAMQYAQYDMRQTKRGDGSIYKVPVQKFIPFSDITQELGAIAEKQKLNIEIDRLSGSYIITDKNGNQAVPSFTQWARTQLGNKFDEQLGITGYVNVRDQVESLMGADPNLTREQAYSQVAKENSYNIYQNFDEYKSSLNTDISVIDKKIADYKSKYGSKIPNEYKETIQQLLDLKANYKKELADIESSKESVDDKLQKSFTQFMNNPGYSLLNYNKDKIAKQWATSYANATAGRKIEVNQAVENEKKRAFDKMMANLSFERDLYKIRYQEQVKLQAAIAKKKAGITTDKEGEPKGGLVSSTAEELEGVDGYEFYRKDYTNSLENIQRNYFDRDVLKIATNSDNFQKDFGVSYSEFTTAVTDVLNRWPLYGKNPKSDNGYLQNYMKVFKLLNRIDPNLKNIPSPATIYQTIGNGVSKYNGTDAASYKSATMKLGAGDENFEQWRTFSNEETKRLALLKERFPEYYSYQYFDEKIHRETGKYVLRGDINPKDRAKIISIITPQWESKYKDRNKMQVSGWRIAGVDEDEFDYGFINEIIKNSTYINDVNTATTFGETALNRAKSFREKYAGMGSELKSFFTPNGIEFKEFYINGEPYYKVSVPLKLDKTKANPMVGDITGGASNFYLTKAEGDRILGSSKKIEFMGKQYDMPSYGELSEIPERIYHNKQVVSWIDDGLRKDASFVPFPSYFNSKYGLSGGGLEVDAINNSLSARFMLPTGEDRDYPLGNITLSDYYKDPERIGNSINQAIVIELEKHINTRIAKMETERMNHQNSVNQRPQDFFNLDDLIK